jgi:hypothetical protein
MFVCYAMAYYSKNVKVAHFQGPFTFYESCLMSFVQSNGMPFVLHGYPIHTCFCYLDTTLMPSVWACHMVHFRLPHYLRIYEAFISGVPSVCIVFVVPDLVGDALRVTSQCRVSDIAPAWMSRRPGCETEPKDWLAPSGSSFLPRRPFVTNLRLPFFVFYFIKLPVPLRPRCRSSSPRRGMIFLLSTSSRPILGPTEPHIQWVIGAFSPGVKRSGY